MSDGIAYFILIVYNLTFFAPILYFAKGEYNFWMIILTIFSFFMLILEVIVLINRKREGENLLATAIRCVKEDLD